MVMNLLDTCFLGLQGSYPEPVDQRYRGEHGRGEREERGLPALTSVPREKPESM